MTLKALKNLPNVKQVIKREDEYVVTLADGWKVYPSQGYAYPITPTRFHSSKTLQGITAFVKRAEVTRQEPVVSMRKLAEDLGAELSDRIMDVLRKNSQNMTAVQVDNFPRIVLSEIAKHYGVYN